MQLIQRASRAFLSANIKEQPNTGRFIISQLQALIDAGFALDLPYDIATLSATNAALEAALAAASTGIHTAVAAGHNALRVWKTQFSATADAISDWAGGDAAKILEAGFHPTKPESKKAQKLHAPAGLRVLPGAHSAEARVEKMTEAVAYVFLALPEGMTHEVFGDDTILIHTPGGNIAVSIVLPRKTRFEGLTPGQSLRITARAINRAGIGAATNAAAVIAQP